MASPDRPKSAKILPAVVLAIVFIGIIAGFLLSRSRTEPSEAETPIEETAPTEAAQNGATSGTQPTDGSVQPATNMDPDLTVDANGLSKATVVMTTDKGVIRFKFYSEDAPNTVKRIVELINKGFYNGLAFHRVVPGFVIQGGDPQGTGAGGSGQNLKAEFNKRKHVEGTVAMARAQDPDSADSQFYIALGPQPHLDGNYTIFGQVVEGMDAVRQIQVGDKMTTVRIE